MTSPLPQLLLTAAALLRAAGDLSPVNVSVVPQENTVLIGSRPDLAMTDQMATVDRIAELVNDAKTGLGVLVPGQERYGYHVEGTFRGASVTATAVKTPGHEAREWERTATTAGTAEALDALAPWAAGLDAASVGDFTVTEGPDGHHVYLLLLADEENNGREVVAAALAGLPATTQLQGRRASAVLPTGHPLRVTVH